MNKPNETLLTITTTLPFCTHEFLQVYLYEKEYIYKSSPASYLLNYVSLCIKPQFIIIGQQRQ